MLSLVENGIIANDGTQHGAIEYPAIHGGSYYLLYDFLNNQQPFNTSRPKAFLNWIIVDEEFKKVSSSYHMGAVQIPKIEAGDAAATFTGPANMTVRRNGWLYVYLSNESNEDVYFDDIKVNHKRGPVVEQSNYYAFGLEIPGLHSQALGFGTSPQNRFRYNGKEMQSKEFSDGSGLSWNDYGARMYDPQIGRWMVQDIKSAKYSFVSPYCYVQNRPTIAIDPDGKDIYIVTKSGAVKLSIDVMQKTELGKSLWNKYANSKTHDIYIVSSRRLDNGNAGGMTIPSDQSSLYIDSRINKKVNKVESFFNLENADRDTKKDFAMINGVVLRHDDRKNSVIALSDEGLKILQEYVGAMTLFHEMDAHVDLRVDGETIQQDHERFGIEQAAEGTDYDYSYYRDSRAYKFWQQILAAAIKSGQIKKTKIMDEMIEEHSKDRKKPLN